MDLRIAGRTALIGCGPFSESLARALESEGVRVTDVLDDRVDIVVAHHPAHELRLLDITDAAQMLDAWSAVVDAIATYRSVLPAMAARGWGRFVWVGSAAAKSLNADSDELGAMVSLAVMAANKVISAESAPSGVTANAVLRGGTATDDDVTAAVAFFCSAGAAYLTGVTLTVDGGIGTAVY